MRRKAALEGTEGADVPLYVTGADCLVETSISGQGSSLLILLPIEQVAPVKEGQLAYMPIFHGEALVGYAEVVVRGIMVNQIALAVAKLHSADFQVPSGSRTLILASGRSLGPT